MSISDCLQDSALNELANQTLSNFDQRVAQLPRDHHCSRFNAEARVLEAQLLTIYQVVVICVRDEEDIDRIAERWGVMVRVCDSFAARLDALAKEHPDCGAAIYHDRILDLRNKCKRLQELHA